MLKQNWQKLHANMLLALEAKTDAEKELASKSETPLQTEVAEKNLQLANLALKKCTRT